MRGRRARGACRERDSRKVESAAIRFNVPEGLATSIDAVIGDITIESDTIEDFVCFVPTGSRLITSAWLSMISTCGFHTSFGAPITFRIRRSRFFFTARSAARAGLRPRTTESRTRQNPIEQAPRRATSVMSYRKKASFPRFPKFLALLGWSPGTDQELLRNEELVGSFSLEGVSRTNAVFNPDKLVWFNAQYLARIPHEQLVTYLKPEHERAGMWRDSFEAFESADGRWFRYLLDILRPRSKTLLDFAPQLKIYLVDPLEFEPAASENSKGSRRHCHCRYRPTDWRRWRN